MVSIDAVRRSNAELAALGSFVAVFVGGTSGIGESTLLALSKKARRPKIYLVGRNELAAERILRDLRLANSEGSYEFIRSDVSLLQNVDSVCNTLREKEKCINLLFLSQGSIYFGSDSKFASLVPLMRETSEGIDRRMALAYYSRARFMHNLLPMMSGFSRVVSVFRGGKERAMDVGGLRHSMSLRKLAYYGATMTTLLMDRFADDYPTVSFVHTYPGLVRTNIWSGFGPILSSLLMFLTWPFSMSVEESGERNLYHSTSARYPPSSSLNPGVDSSEKGTAQDTGSSLNQGVHSIDWDGEKRNNQALLSFLRNSLRSQIWAHTYNIFEKAETVALLTAARP